MRPNEKNSVDSFATNDTQLICPTTVVRDVFPSKEIVLEDVFA